MQVGADGQPTRVTRFFPFSPIVCGAAAVGFYAPPESRRRLRATKRSSMR